MAAIWHEERNSGKDRKWLVCWRSRKLGVRGSAICYTWAQCQEFEKKKRDEIRRMELGLVGPVATEPMAWDQFVRQYEAYAKAHKAPRTWAHFEKPTLDDFGAHTGKRPPQAISVQDVEQWKLGLLERLGPHTVRMRLRSIKSIFSYGLKMGIFLSNPAAKISMPKAPTVGRVLGNQEIAALLERVPPAVARGVIFTLYTGVRRNELLSLDWRTVRRAQEPWTVEIEAGNTKTKNARVIPIHATAQEAMGGPKDSGRVFDDLSVDIIEPAIRAAAKAAKLGRVRVHDLRHTWATRYMEKTGDIFGLMQLGGWRSVASMARYQHLTHARADGVLSLDFGQITHSRPTKDGKADNFKSKKC